MPREKSFTAIALNDLLRKKLFYILLLRIVRLKICLKLLSKLFKNYDEDCINYKSIEDQKAPIHYAAEYSTCADILSTIIN